MFFTSAFVPYSAWPTGRTETFASQRNEPSSMLPVETPSARTIERSFWRYARASAAERMSGLLTISISGTPERFMSAKLAACPEESVPCTSRAVSSSWWTRSMPIRRTVPSTSTSIQPLMANGRSYCEIWYPLTRSGYG